MIFWAFGFVCTCFIALELYDVWSELNSRGRSKVIKFITKGVITSLILASVLSVIVFLF